MRYNFEWDPIKAQENLRKHGISFERAADLFLDPLAVSVFDAEHSEEEDDGSPLAGIATEGSSFSSIRLGEVSADESKVRIISARKATKREARQYEAMER